MLRNRRDQGKKIKRRLNLLGKPDLTLVLPHAPWCESHMTFSPKVKMLASVLVSEMLADMGQS